jgi:hypothetical protein
LAGLIALLWPAAEKSLALHLASLADGNVSLRQIRSSRDLEIGKLLEKLDRLDPLRLELLDPAPLRRLLSAGQDRHLRIAVRFQFLLDLVAVQHSQGSVLPVSSGPGIQLRSLFKKIHYKTMMVERHPCEEVVWEFKGY